LDTVSRIVVQPIVTQAWYQWIYSTDIGTCNWTALTECIVVQVVSAITEWTYSVWTDLAINRAWGAWNIN
jgi:hypothetical protein